MYSCYLCDEPVPASKVQVCPASEGKMFHASFCDRPHGSEQVRVLCDECAEFDAEEATKDRAIRRAESGYAD